MPITTLSQHALGDIVALYRQDVSSGKVGLSLVPAAALAAVVPGRDDCRSDPAIRGVWHIWKPPADRIDPLVHVHVSGRALGAGFPAGRTLRGSASTDALKLVDQQREEVAGVVSVRTRLADGAGLEAEHVLTWRPGEGALTVQTQVRNASAAPLAIELLTSASLDGITPFAADDAAGRLRLHRWRAAWSNEAMQISEDLEVLGLERSWIGHSVQVERFGQAGTMPVNGWHPCAVVEDTVAGVCWGLQLRWGGSWQIECYRRDDRLALSGGLADRDVGHWRKNLAPGESFSAPSAWVTCSPGSVEQCCERLVRMQLPAAEAAPAIEHDLPIMFNEWCTTWGDPTHARVTALADRLKGTPVRFLVIDAGWYKPDAGGNWGDAHGDWQPSAKMFPNGIAATAAAIRERGLIPGLWFEMETVGAQSQAFVKQRADLLHRDGALLQVGARAFWDLRRESAHAYLEERVAGLLRDAGFGYLKVDYNESTGPIVDGDESPGEGLRRHQVGVERWWGRLRQLLPDLVIETCSSGGHRIEPSMLALAAQASFSDAHETLEIPLVAADLHRLMLPRQSQIWAVLHETDDDRRLVYSLAATFLGRMCLSGPVEQLAPAQWAIACKAMELYRQVWRVIAHGTSRLHGERTGGRRSPRGWQAVVRYADSGAQALVVVHVFPGAAGASVTLPLTGGPWRIGGTLTSEGAAPVITAEGLRLHLAAEWSGQVIELIRN